MAIHILHTASAGNEGSVERARATFVTVMSSRRVSMTETEIFEASRQAGGMFDLAASSSGGQLSELWDSQSDPGPSEHESQGGRLQSLEAPQSR